MSYCLTSQVTLLKQNIGTVHRPSSTAATAPTARDVQPSNTMSNSSSSSSVPTNSSVASCSTRTPSVEEREGAGGVGSVTGAGNSSSTVSSDNETDGGVQAQGQCQPKAVNNVLDPKFLESLNAEILCGPVRLCGHAIYASDCNGLLTMTSSPDSTSSATGLITLTSSQLINAKSRSLLLHIKGFDNIQVSGLPMSLSVKDKKDKQNDARRAYLEKMVSGCVKKQKLIKGTHRFLFV